MWEPLLPLSRRPKYLSSRPLTDYPGIGSSEAPLVQLQLVRSITSQNGGTAHSDETRHHARYVCSCRSYGGRFGSPRGHLHHPDSVRAIIIQKRGSRMNRPMSRFGNARGKIGPEPVHELANLKAKFHVPRATRLRHSDPVRARALRSGHVAAHAFRTVPGKAGHSSHAVPRLRTTLHSIRIGKNAARRCSHDRRLGQI